MKIEKIENGFIVMLGSEPCDLPERYVFNDGDEMLSFIAEHFAIYQAESPQDTDSTEMVEAEAGEEYDEFAKTVWKGGPDPVKPMADLSGSYVTNGALAPETD